MQTGNIKINGEDITVIFTGKKYYFHSNYYGVVGIATREIESDECDHKRFILIAGNINIYRDKYINAMKRYITKYENKFVACDVKYVDSGELCNHYLDIEDKKYLI